MNTIAVKTKAFKLEVTSRQLTEVEEAQISKALEEAALSICAILDVDIPPSFNDAVLITGTKKAEIYE